MSAAAEAYSSAFRSLGHPRQLAQHLLVGMGAASFWRGAWYVLDDHLFPNDKVSSALASLSLGTLGMAVSQGIVGRAERLAERLTKVITTHNAAAAGSTNGAASSSTRKRTSRRRWPRRLTHNARSSVAPSGFLLAASRAGALYTVAMSAVLIWRGTWIGWDILYETLHPKQQADFSSSKDHHHAHSPGQICIQSTDAGHLTQSGALSHLSAVILLLSSGFFASVLAPPAAACIIRDASVRRAAGRSKVRPAMPKLADRLPVLRRSIVTNRSNRHLSRRRALEPSAAQKIL